MASASLAETLTVVIVTSPVPCHPSTELIDRLLLSLKLFRSVERVSILVVCDGASADSKKTKRQAALSDERIAAYAAYKARILARWGRVRAIGL